MSNTILVVTGDGNTRQSLCDILGSEGYRVVPLHTGAEVLAHDNWMPYGAIILDYRLPDETAETLLPHLRRLAPDTAVIIATAFSDLPATIGTFPLGATDYVLRPIHPHELRSRLGRIMDHRRNRETLLAKTEELRMTTRQLWQAARLAGVGELAASIAHELNNPLGTISLRVEGVLAKTPSDDPRRHALEVIEQEVERIGNLVANLLQFSRAGVDKLSTVDVCEEMTKTLELVEHHLRKWKIRVQSVSAPGVPVIYADRQQLRQVFLNLFTNAADAMPNGGRLALQVCAVELAGRPAVAVEVIDTGTGIPPDLLPRVTDPFFTTKEEDKGTGLGLAICKRIVEQHQGTLEVESTVGVGTTVRITLPVRRAENSGRLLAD